MNMTTIKRREYTFLHENYMIPTFTGCETGVKNGRCQAPCTHCKNVSYCSPVSRSCNSEGCAFSGYRAPLCRGE